MRTARVPGYQAERRDAGAANLAGSGGRGRAGKSYEPPRRLS